MHTPDTAVVVEDGFSVDEVRAAMRTSWLRARAAATRFWK